ncbi:hypothetical protein SAMN05421594_0054 [Chryseobacterium oleae]|uniref:Uncharacterized protein n=1 Tax=Chryseobacterium oleae TaxID=491207 RepID=A0A1I4V9J2_CHROL|nr:hypothetical protein [Chryseobacterium oleae]SFM97862.1 hypothetical protein SAMN05421594_0054 [Chryseobacterium oleae]
MNEHEKNVLVSSGGLANESKDVIWENPHPISLNFKTASEKALASVVTGIVSNSDNTQILWFRDLPFDAILPVKPFKKDFTPEKSFILGKVYFFPYKTPPRSDDFRGSIGNVDMQVSPLSTDPEYVLTGEMNGCSIIITKETADSKSFTAWHFPSPDSYKKVYEQFLEKYKGKIYGEIKYSDYGGTKDGETDGVNYLFYNRSRSLWELSCIPVKRVVKLDPADLKKWNGNWVEKSSVPRKKRDLNFSKPIK